VGRVEPVGCERGDDAAAEQRGDEGERREVADADEVGDQDLDPDERRISAIVLSM
jgi:hypothetical protein